MASRRLALPAGWLAEERAECGAGVQGDGHRPGTVGGHRHNRAAAQGDPNATLLYFLAPLIFSKASPAALRTSR